MTKEKWKTVDFGIVKIEYLPMKYWTTSRKTIVIAGVVIILMALGLEIFEVLL